ncbi:hypothetical protein QQS21_008496 [Conoideocrella luteorostrata]|uniref:Aminoglycoside phosphotransferase domain-containing protein n=1 Tax=Conoideocrella luteorostrata TaxID=1105319 RepID=A0AAJ0FWH4_9HYPO|nr:hypothetical protein QQS21_008496 [Conoideocrella luteorostrata]
MVGPTDRSAEFIGAAKLTNISSLSNGLEFDVFRGLSPKYGDVVLRIPKHKIFQNVNDPNSSARDLIKQEMAIYTLLAHTPIPVPRPREFLEVDDYPAMLSDYMPDDGTQASDTDKGRMLALLHTYIPVPHNWQHSLVAMEGAEIFTTLTHRMVRRFEQLAKEVPLSESWIPPRSVLERVAETLRQRSVSPSLLHMDFRDANFRTTEKIITTVLDWTNALIGPPAVEICRIMELVDPGPGFLDGYSSLARVPHLEHEEETFLRLDARLMLTLVYISEAPDEKSRVVSLKRLEELARALQE